jgi:Tfp pilus assembly protein PilV
MAERSTAGARRTGTAGGFALAEVLVAAAVLAVGLLGLGCLELAAASAAETARGRRLAAALVRNVLEAWPGETGSRTYDREGRLEPTGPGQVRVTITRLSDVGPAARFRVEAAWSGGRPGRPQRLALTGLTRPHRAMPRPVAP